MFNQVRGKDGIHPIRQLGRQTGGASRHDLIPLRKQAVAQTIVRFHPPVHNPVPSAPIGEFAQARSDLEHAGDGESAHQFSMQSVPTSLGQPARFPEVSSLKWSYFMRRLPRRSGVGLLFVMDDAHPGASGLYLCGETSLYIGANQGTPKRKEQEKAGQIGQESRGQ